MIERLQKLEVKFESVTLQLEKYQIKRDKYIKLNKSTFSLDNKIEDLECKQYEIQNKIEELEKCN